MTATESLVFRTINDFCNKIGTKRTIRGAWDLSAFGGKADISQAHSQRVPCSPSFDFSGGRTSWRPANFIAPRPDALARSRTDRDRLLLNLLPNAVGLGRKETDGERQGT